MKTNRFRLLLVGLFLPLLCACQGPDPIRLRSERANHALAARCAEGWFAALPWTEHDKMLVEKALSDWDRALKADEALLQWPVGGAK
jgi:hypothetical protein